MKKVKLGSLVKNIGGSPFEKYVSEEGEYHFISIGNYTVDGKYQDDGKRVKLNDKTKEKILNKNDLVMILNDKTTTGDLIGSTILIDEDNKYIYNQRSERLICSNKVLPQYLWYYLNSDVFRKEIFKLAQGGTQIYVNFKDVKNILIYLPSLEKQKKLINSLNIIDKSLNQLETLKLEYKNLKKGIIHNFINE